MGVQIRLGCAHLEEALALLGQAGLTGGMSKLAVEIREGLRQLKPDCLIEHLKVRLRWLPERGSPTSCRPGVHTQGCGSHGRAPPPPPPPPSPPSGLSGRRQARLRVWSGPR